MRRIPELDALRGIAALVIVVFHMRFLDRAPALGTAVDLFFVLSGYLITTILLDQGRSPGFFRAFYARRALRIWPIYYLALVACIALNPLLKRPEPMAGFWWYAGYLQYVPGYWGGETPPFSRLFSHTWTLAIEEQFYLLWPLAVVLAGRRRLRWAIVPLLIVPTILRTWGFHRHMLLTRCDGLALGALLADLMYDRKRVVANRRAYLGGFAAVGVIAALAWRVGCPLMASLDGSTPAMWAIRAFALSTAASCWLYFALVGVVLLCQESPTLSLLRDRRLVHLGTISYGIYLYHPFVLIFVPMAREALGIKLAPWMLDVAEIGACIGLAEVSWRLVERPLLRLKDRFPYGRAPSAANHRPHLLERSEPPAGRAEGSRSAATAGSSSVRRDDGDEPA
jgi:peptidoglycan/LPS O-acetylase OafA/YrhL